MALRDALRSRLALRIYFVGLAQFAVIATTVVLVLHANRPRGGGPAEAEARYVAAHVAPLLADPSAVERELRSVGAAFRTSARVVDPGGSVIAATPDAPVALGRCAPSDKAPLAPGERRCITTPVRFPDGRDGLLELATRGPPPAPPFGTRVVPLVLVVVGISSWLLARSLTRPLDALSNAARAFGRGDLGARVRLYRRDELGDVARAFDEMAERVTELLRAEKELLANVSHELRTPLARIRVALDLAADGDADAARESLKEIAGDLDELERLIADVLTAARLDLGDGSSHAGTLPLRRERVDVRELLAHAASRLRAAHPERTLHVDVADELPSVDGDPVLLRRVVDNLLENAHKYTVDPALPIDLVARAPSDVEIEVRDRGIGIAPADLERVFRPFFRADKSRTRATGGLGLGLALAKRIVDAHGGTIALESAPGEGTRARVRLPPAAGADAQRGAKLAASADLAHR